MVIVMPMTETANQSMAPLQLVQRALPVTSANALLTCLIDAWLQSSGTSACHVSLITDKQLSSAFIDPVRFEKPQLTHESLPSTAFEWSATLATESLKSIVDDKSETLTSVTVVPFEFGGHSLGGALLLGDVEDTEALATLATVSAQLIEQLRNVQTSPSNLDPASESRLRDLKLEAMAEFAAGSGHEINNPVATIGRSALLLKTETDPERRRILETIGGQAYRIRDMIGDAMTYARPPEPVFEEFSPAGDILQICGSLQQQFADKNATFESSLDETIQLTADREQFRVVASCLIKNSLEAITENGLIQIELANLQPHVRFTVSDNGVGLSEVEREHLFDPFYSGRQAGRGLGFGLSKCWQILRLHSGTVEAVERKNGANGLTVATLWPR